MKTTGASFVRAAALPAVLGILLAAAEAEGAPGAFDVSSPANGAWCAATCAFAWQASSSAASYQLFVDGALKKDGIAPASPPGYALAAGEALSDGMHTWYAVAKDSSGATQQSTSTFSVRVDASPPAAPALVSPAADAWIASASPTVSWSASGDSGSGLAGYEIWLDGAAAVTGISPSATSAPVSLPATTAYDKSFAKECPGDWEWTSGTWYCGAAGGAWHLSLGNGDSPPYGTAAMGGVIDLSNAGHAELQLYHKWLNQSSALEIGASADAGASWQAVATLPANAARDNTQLSAISLDDATGSASSKVRLAGKVSAGEGWYVDWVKVVAVSGGEHSWQVVAVDAAGNRTPSETRRFRYDLPPARFDLASPADGAWTANAKPTFAWNGTTDAGSGLAGYQIWLDGALYIDGIGAAATSAAATKSIQDGSHVWQALAVDAAGAVRKSNQARKIGIDTAPPVDFGIGSCDVNYAVPTPSLCWSPSSDVGSGLDRYQLVVDGAVARDGIDASGTTCATPAATLPEGRHAYTVKAFDKAGNAQPSYETACQFAVDFNPPAAFDPVSPVEQPRYPSGTDYPAVSLTPTFTWTPSGSTGSGLDHYEIFVSELYTGKMVCVADAVPATATSFTIAKPVEPGIHGWNVRAVDKIGGFTWANAGQEGRRYFKAACTGDCETQAEPTPEPRPEPAVEPSRDAGVDGLLASGADGSGTSRADTPAAAGPEPQADGGPSRGDVGAAIPDAATISDAAPTRDAAFADAGFSGGDAPMVGAEAGALAPIADGPTVLADAKVTAVSDMAAARIDGAQLNALDAPGVGGGTAAKGNASGCGCSLGGHDASTPSWLFLLVGAAAAVVFVRRRLKSRGEQ